MARGVAVPASPATSGWNLRSALNTSGGWSHVLRQTRTPEGGMTFEEFAAARMPGVLRFAAVLAGDRATAEDLAQEVLIRAYSRWDRIGCVDRPEFYVRKMLLNEFLSW